MARKALLIGIPNVRVAPLPGVVNDIAALRSLLAQNESKLQNFDVTALCRAPDDSGEDLTRARLLGHLQNFTRGANHDDLLIYLAGHGVPWLNDVHLATTDFEAAQFGVSLTEVLSVLEGSKARSAALIADFCHAGAAANDPRPWEDGIRDLFQTVRLRSGLSVLTSGRSDEFAQESEALAGARSPFNECLCLALEGGCADGFGVIDLAAAFRFCHQAFSATGSRPVYKTYSESPFILRRARARVSIEAMERLTHRFPTPAFILPVSSAMDDNGRWIPEASRTPEQQTYYDLREYRGLNLIDWSPCQDLWHALRDGQSVKLTAAGRHFWSLVHQKRLTLD